ncbi:hypothetical protein BH10BAC2_BH10BAC2_24040 [soil metagenome]
MKKKTLNFALFLFFALLFSCKKDLESNLSVTDINNATLCDCGSQWEGHYSLQGQPDVFTNYSTFISGGFAQLKNSPYLPTYYTGIKIRVPSAYTISGDAVKLTLNLKNPSGVFGSVNHNDVTLVLYGENANAFATFIGSSVNQQFTQLKVGNQGITNDPGLIYKFQNWNIVTLIANNNKLSLYRNNGSLVKEISYTGSGIGKLLYIKVYFKGSGSVDWIKIIDSKTGQTRMSEEFNTNSQSTAYWYWPI